MKRIMAIAAVLFLSTAFCLVFAFNADCGDGKGRREGHSMNHSGAPADHDWKGAWAGRMYAIGICNDNPYVLEVLDIGEGTFTYMGHSSWVAKICLDTTKNPAEGQGIAMITGADGDVLYLTVSIKSWGLAGDVAPRWEEEEVVIGGTGRLAGAIGSGFSSGSWTPDPPGTYPGGLGMSFTWDGTTVAEVTH